MDSALGDSIAGIKPTKQGKIPQRQAIFLTEREKALELDHPVRRFILLIMDRGVPDRITVETIDDLTKEKVRERVPILRDILSVTEIVKMSKEHLDIPDLTRNQVNHHLPRMIEEGFIIHYGTLETGKRTTDYYRRTAKQYVVTMETPNLGADFLRGREAKRLIQSLSQFDIELTKQEVNELIEIRVKLELLQDRWRSKIAGLIKQDVMLPDIVDLYHWMLEAYAMGSDEYVQLFKRFGEILFRDMEADL